MKPNAWAVFTSFPPEREGHADVSFWVTQKGYNAGLYPLLYAAIDEWLKTTWPFKHVHYTNAELPDK